MLGDLAEAVLAALAVLTWAVTWAAFTWAVTWAAFTWAATSAVLTWAAIWVEPTWAAASDANSIAIIATAVTSHPTVMRMALAAWIAPSTTGNTPGNGRTAVTEVPILSRGACRRATSRRQAFEWR